MQKYWFLRFKITLINTSFYCSQNTKTIAGDETRIANKAQPKFNPEDMFYDMSGDKYLVIFNHTKYKTTRYFQYVICFF